MAVITISRQTGSGGDEIAAYLVKLLHIHLVNRSYLEKAIYDYCLVKTIRQPPLPEIIPPAVERSGAGLAYRQVLKAVLLNLACREDLILVGYGGQAVFRDFESAFNVRIVGSFRNRVRRVAAANNITRAEATGLIRKKDLERRTFLKEIFRMEIGKQHNYDLILNADRISDIKGATIIASSFQTAMGGLLGSTDEYSKYMKRHHIEKIDLVWDRHLSEEPVSQIVFAHESEEEFAHVLDFYRIKWEYEPTEFPIEWDETGEVTESFRPDFYLPEFDTYIELTTMKQDLVTKKNRKIKKLRKVRPDINLKIFYGRDYKHMLSKFGID